LSLAFSFRCMYLKGFGKRCLEKFLLKHLKTGKLYFDIFLLSQFKEKITVSERLVLKYIMSMIFKNLQRTLRSICSTLSIAISVINDIFRMRLAGRRDECLIYLGGRGNMIHIYRNLC
jgi:hypothetical protein